MNLAFHAESLKKAATLFSIFIFLLWAGGRLAAKIQSQRIYLKEAREKISTLRAIAASASELERKQKALEARWKNVSQRLAQEEKVSYFLKQLISASRKTAVTVAAMRPEGPTAKGDLLEFSIEAQVDGSQAALGRFLNRLETQTNFIRLENATFKMKQDKIPELSCLLRLAAFLPAAGTSAKARNEEEASPKEMAMRLLEFGLISEEKEEAPKPYRGMSSKNLFLPVYLEAVLAPKPIPPPPYELKGVVPDAARPMAVLLDPRTGATMMLGVGAPLDGGDYTLTDILSHEVIITDKKGKATTLPLYK